MLDLPAVVNEFPSVGAMLRPDRESIGQHGFSGADVWPVVTETGRYAVRRWPLGSDSLRLAGLHQLLAFLGDAGLNFVAVPQRTRSGTTLVVRDGHLFQVEPWLPGTADYHAHPNRARLAGAMAALAQWHRASAQFQPAREHATWFASARDQPSPAVIERRVRLRSLSARQVRSWRDMALLHILPPLHVGIEYVSEQIIRQAPAVLSLLDLAAATTIPLQPVLRDVWHDHVLFTNDEVTGLIDPSACRAESVAADLARLLGSLVGDNREEWDFALREYQRHRPLSTTELALVPVLDRSGVLLSGATWLEWLGPQQRFEGNDQRIVCRIEGICRRLESMA